MSPQQRRDRAQARNLNDRIFRVDPKAKVFIHAGYAHVKERADSTWYPMAAYLRELTGIDPVTADQTMLSEMDAPEREHAGYRAAVAAGLVAEKPVVLIDSAGRPVSPVAFGVDFQVLTPRTSYLRGRPSWMALGTRRRAVNIAVPECAGRHCLVEARLVGDGDDAVPLDRTEARGDTVTLFLPPARRTRVRVLSPSAEVLRTFEAVPR